MNRRDWLSGGATTTLDGEPIFYRVDGPSDATRGAIPTLLFVHGYPTSSHDWAPVVERLRARYRCVTFDLLGFGASAKLRRDYSYALQHRVLAQVVAAAKIDRAVLVVHDYAVTLGQDLLGGAPFLLDGVIFLNGGLDPAQHRPRPVQRFLLTWLGRTVGPLLLRRRAVLAALREVLVKKDALPEDDTWESISSHGGLHAMPRLLHYIAERRARRDELLASLRSPTPKAFAWGMDDPVSGAHVLDAIRPLVGDAAMLELRGVGHYPQLEAPDEVARFIDDWASRHGGDRETEGRNPAPRA